MAITVLTKENFQKEVMESKDAVLIDFWAPWCGPCRMVSPIVDEIANEAHDGLKVCKVIVDEEQELAMQYRIMSIPTMLVIKGGKVVNQSVGVQPKRRHSPDDTQRLIRRPGQSNRPALQQKRTRDQTHILPTEEQREADVRFLLYTDIL